VAVVWGTHLFTAQKPASECYVIERFIGTIAQRSDFFALLDVVGGLRVVRNRTKNLR